MLLYGNKDLRVIASFLARLVKGEFVDSAQSPLFSITNESTNEKQKGITGRNPDGYSEG